MNNCVEAESNQEWAAIAREHRELEIDRASRIFERQRQAAIENAEARAPALQGGNL